MGISHSTPAYEKRSNLTMSKSNSRDHFVPSFISLSPDHYGARQRKRMDQLIWVLCLYAASKGLCISWIRILPNRFLKTSMSTPRLYSLPARNQALLHFPCSFRGLVGCWFDGSSTLNGWGAGIVLTSEAGKEISLSYKLDFRCSNKQWSWVRSPDIWTPYCTWDVHQSH